MSKLEFLDSINVVKLSDLKKYDEKLYEKAKASIIAEEDEEYFNEKEQEDKLVGACFIFDWSNEGVGFWEGVLDDVLTKMKQVS